MIRPPAPPRVEAPAGLADVGELGEPWASTAWQHAVAIAAFDPSGAAFSHPVRAGSR